ncbi:flagellar hook-associated protein 2 [Lentibacillus sediminis]|uniref:flagellar hook-associated protein 2 n=1 Tax=Lentibacillus sediminis TaxID=1940529 RepID=UPI000C1B8EF4|nr:flagellar hook-associated protein 2 [Lentibacillus sediminis]
MRIGGLASGMDIDSLVNQLMTAERIPLNKMEQDRTLLEWERDGFREINTKLSELDNMMLDMKLSPTYNSKSVHSSNDSAVTATATSASSNGLYSLEVTDLATSAMRISAPLNNVEDPSQPLDIDEFGTFTFSTYDENEKKMKAHEFEVTRGDSLNDVLKQITDADNNVRAFFDEQSKQVILETTRTGDYNQEGDGKEISFDADNTFFTDVLQLDPAAEEKGGTDATFTYNKNLELTSKSNSYELNGITFQFQDVGSANLTVNNDVDSAVEKITEFVEKYNEVVEEMSGTQQEERYRDYPPLTDEQREEMSESEIELWEERAKSGILRGESAITSGLFSMRQSWYANVETDGAFQSLTEVGITTTSDYLDGGKLEIDEEVLRSKLEEDPASVQQLFSNSSEGADRGLINRLEDSLGATMDQIGERAGSGGDTLENYTLGREMKDLEERITAFEDRLTQVENRYWSQFTAMETAISRMNQQSTMLMNNFGGGNM